MNQDLFDTQEKAEQAIAAFMALKEVEGWKLVVAIIDANIEIVTQNILNGVNNETKEDIDRLRDRLKIYKEVRNTPDLMIGKLKKQDGQQIDFDPYSDVEAVIKERKDREKV